MDIEAAAAKREERQAVLMILLYALLESTGGVLIKLIPWNAFAIAGFRGLIAGCVMLVYFSVSGLNLRFSRYAFLNGALLGTAFLTFIVGNKLTAAANVVALQYTAPIFVLMFSALFYKRKYSGRDIFAAVITVLGVSFFFLDGLSGGGLWGNCISILSGAALGGSFVVAGNSSHADRMNGILFGHLLVAFIAVPIGLLYGIEPRPTAIVGILTIGIFQVGIPFILYGLGARRCPPLAVILLNAVEPILNPVWVFLVVGEQPGRFALLGAVVVLSSVTIWYLTDKRA